MIRLLPILLLLFACTPKYPAAPLICRHKAIAVASAYQQTNPQYTCGVAIGFGFGSNIGVAHSQACIVEQPSKGVEGCVPLVMWIMGGGVEKIVVGKWDHWFNPIWVETVENFARGTYSN